VPSWRAVLICILLYAKILFRLYSNVLSQQQKYIGKRRFWIQSIFTQRMGRFQGASDNLVLEMQTIDRDKFFNYFRMTSELFKELLAL